MKPTDFPQSNTVYGKDQPEYLPLPAHRTEDGYVVSCWELTEEEVEQISQTRKLWVGQLTFNHPLQPQALIVEDPFK